MTTTKEDQQQSQARRLGYFPRVNAEVVTDYAEAENSNYRHKFRLHLDVPLDVGAWNAVREALDENRFGKALQLIVQSAPSGGDPREREIAIKVLTAALSR